MTLFRTMAETVIAKYTNRFALASSQTIYCSDGGRSQLCFAFVLVFAVRTMLGVIIST